VGNTFLEAWDLVLLLELLLELALVRALL